MTAPRRFVTTAEAAALFGRSRSSIVRAIDRGELVAVRFGRSYFVDLEAVTKQAEAEAERRRDLAERGRLL